MYSTPITRLRPTAFIIAIDRSGSMAEPITFNGERMAKSEAVALVANNLIDELINRARREEGVADYYDLAVVGYSGDGVELLLDAGEGFVKPSQLIVRDVPCRKLIRERRLPDGRAVMAITEHNMWIAPKAAGITPMYDALRRVVTLTENWCRRNTNRTSYPPTVFHITDGEASDCDESQIRDIASRIRNKGTEDGHTLLFNIHLGASDDETRQHVIFPSSPEELPDRKYARLLYDISSALPQRYEPLVAEMKTAAVQPPFRGMGYNASIADLVAMMNIGSVTSSLI